MAGFEETRDLLASHYAVLAFLTALGTIQLAAARGALSGVSLGPSPRSTRLTGIVLILTGFAFYYLAPLWVSGPWGSTGPGSGAWGVASFGELTGARNINDVDGGLSGNTQAVILSAATLSALALSALTGMVRLSRRPPPQPTESSSGLETLETSTLVQAMRSVRHGIRSNGDSPGLRSSHNGGR